MRARAVRPAIATGAQVDGGDAGALAPCIRYCACLVTTCTSVPGFPFTSYEQCTDHSVTLTPEERECWPLWCDQAKRSIADRTHICEHAWGKYGLDECDAL